MSFSQEIKFKIGADTVALEKSMTNVGAVAQRTMKSVDDITKGSFAEARKLADFREKQYYKEANIVGKMKIVTAELASNIKERNKFEEGSTEYLKRQQAIEEKISGLRKLQRTYASSQLTGTPSVKAMEKEKEQIAKKEKSDLEKRMATRTAMLEKANAKEKQLIEKNAKFEQASNIRTAFQKIKAQEAAAKQQEQQQGKAQQSRQATEEGGALSSGLLGGIAKRGLFMAVGTIVTELLAVIPSYFSRQAEYAQGKEQATGSQADILKGTIGQIGGFEGKIRGLKDDSKVIAQKMAITKDALKDLTSGAMGKVNDLVNPLYQGKVDELVKSLRELEVAQTAAGNEQFLVERQQRIAVGTLQAQLSVVAELNQKRREGTLTAVAEADAELALARSLDAVERANNQTEEQAMASKVRIESAIAKKETAERTQNLSRAAADDELKTISNINEQRKKGQLTSLTVAEAELKHLQTLDAQQKTVHQTVEEQKAMAIAIAKAQGNVDQQRIAYQRERDTLAMQAAAIEDINQLRSTGSLNAINSAKTELRLARQIDEVQKRNGQTALEAAASANRIKQAQGAVDAAIQNMSQRQIDVRRDLTGQATQGRFFKNGQRRPRSESERLAQQAMDAREKARGAILTGAAGEAAYQQKRAMGLEGTVGERLSRGSRMMQAPMTGDLTAIASTLENSNALLEAIKDSLKPSSVN